ncbi:MAG: HD domain-containing protein [Actinomycetota bacterium]|nr:HD domain-containing protein [Actinomycetota bacterium]
MPAGRWAPTPTHGASTRGRIMLAAAALLFAGVYLLRELHPNPADATLVLFVVPIALCALEFGALGGLAAGLVGVCLVLAWDLSHAETADLGPLGYASRVTAFLMLGGLVGRFVTERKSLERRIARGEELSLDLLATADFQGYFRRLNPAWTAALGYSERELRARPFLDFVHPDDRERTREELGKLVQGAPVTNAFRNRYRTREGSYVWLEWKARAMPDEGLVYASARDVTAQQQADEANRNNSEVLERTVRERTRDLEEARLETLQRLALAAEYRDDETQRHTERVGQTAEQIARGLGLPAETVETLRSAAPLHDVGKLAVPDAILLKPGRLTADEFRAMQEHTHTGAAILAGSRSRTLQVAEEIALTHHERWDGSGYPGGLEGWEIPISGRITALADVFDAITHERPYKEAWPIDVALEEIRRLRGSHFDPEVCDVFVELVEEGAIPPERSLQASP